jgi:putative ABC transport system permease protein
VLSALGIAIGIAALTAITGLSASSQAQLLEQLDAQGANLIMVSPSTQGGTTATLPDTAVAMVGRIPAVRSVAVLRAVPDDIKAYKNDLVPVSQSNGLVLAATGPEYLGAIDGAMAQGEWFDEAARGLPEVVLGSQAARLLGVHRAGDRIWAGQEWYAVRGILQPRPLTLDLDASVLLGDEWSETHLWPSRPSGEENPGHLTSLAIRADAADAPALRRLLPRAVDPAHPQNVEVSNPSDLVASRNLVDDSFSGLVIGLGGVALLVGAIGIANTMIVAVLERRGEIGLRRALGARSSHIVRQFMIECVLLSAAGGLGGWCVGAVSVCAFTALAGQVAALPWYTAVAYPAIAVGVGLVAGLHPAMRAARITPVAALKGI